MKARYVMLLTLVFAFAITGCKNRFEEYEPPYSTFDERMAAADRPLMTPDDQMPQGMEEQYAYSGSQGYSASDDQRIPGHGRTASNSGSSDTEVPFTESRKPTVNVGAL